MTILDATSCYRPAPKGLKGWLVDRMLGLAPTFFGFLRKCKPIIGVGGTWIVTLHDDVREVFDTDAAFSVPYAENLTVITGGPSFFLGLGDTPAYRAQLNAMIAVVRPSDLKKLGDEAERRATDFVAQSEGSLEVVDFIRRVTFDLLGTYFGVPEPARGNLAVWSSRLFEFQFTGSPTDAAWLAEIEEIGAAFRTHLDDVIARRHAAPGNTDDVLARCLAFQAEGKPGYSDEEIRTALLCMVVGGPPQPPMVVPQAIEQLLRRPVWLASAHAAAVGNCDKRLHDMLYEAMRFDPLAHGLKRTALMDWTIAKGTNRAKTVPRGATVIAAFSSAMMDQRRIPDPKIFNPERQAYEYVHFGHGLHECFGRHINHATLHRMIKPLLARNNLRRAPGADGLLRKSGAFADRLEVMFD